MMAHNERVLSFACEGDQLIGILHAGSEQATTGVIVVVGGPQYRVGSHRQFVLLARALAAQGIPVLRFDYRGMGDSSGAMRDFEVIDADLRAACDAFCIDQPQLKKIVLWGLCDAASANLFYASKDARIAALVLLNPWLRQAQAQARTVIQHYYKKRLLSADLWRKLLRGEFDLRSSLRSLLATLKQALWPANLRLVNKGSPNATGAKPANAPVASLSQRMAAGWQRFNGPILLVLSGDDLVAKEFETVAANASEWQGLRTAERVQTVTMLTANHTFARAEWRDAVADATAQFVRDLQ